MSIEGPTYNQENRSKSSSTHRYESSSYEITVHDISTALQSEGNEFGQVLSGSLTLTGRLKSATLVFPSESIAGGRLERLKWTATPCGKSRIYVEINLDERLHDVRSEDIFYLPFVRNEIMDPSYGLLLRFSPKQNVYSREFSLLIFSSVHRVHGRIRSIP